MTQRPFHTVTFRPFLHQSAVPIGGDELRDGGAQIVFWTHQCSEHPSDFAGCKMPEPVEPLLSVPWSGLEGHVQVENGPGAEDEDGYTAPDNVQGATDRLGDKSRTRRWKGTIWLEIGAPHGGPIDKIGRLVKTIVTFHPYRVGEDDRERASDSTFSHEHTLLVVVVGVQKTAGTRGDCPLKREQLRKIGGPPSHSCSHKRMLVTYQRGHAIVQEPVQESA